MEIEDRWTALRGARDKEEEIAEEIRTLGKEVKDLTAELNDLIASGGNKKDWAKLRKVWADIDSSLDERKGLRVQLGAVRDRIAVLIRTGEDPADDGQTEMDMPRKPEL
jgi:hypothetical protein